MKLRHSMKPKEVRVDLVVQDYKKKGEVSSSPFFVKIFAKTKIFSYLCKKNSDI